MLFFLSDFGHADAYVGIVEAVMAGIAPAARVVHLAHDVPPQDLRAGSLALWSAIPYLPDGAIVLAVVDPGVGSARSAIAARGEHLTYVGPDNGLFGAAWLRDPPRVVHEITTRLGSGATTFDGRDVFGPAAARLALGAAIETLGPTFARPPAPAIVTPTSGDVGEIWSFDRYGNAITSLEGGAQAIVVAGQRLAIATHYASVEVGAPVAYVGSSGLIEVAVRDGSAHASLGLNAGDRVARLS